MIITKLIGGLGNQLFQYAIARSLSIRNNDVFKIDNSSFFEFYNLHKYCINNFNIEENIASKKEIKKFRSVNRLFYKELPFLKPKITLIKEKQFGFDPEAFNAKGDIYLEGYWQSEEYFKDIRDIILNDFTVKIEPSNENKKHIEKINSTNSVCMHIRRGDYISNQTTNNFHGTCDLDYYKRAIEIIAAKVSDPVFFIFSDDPAWVKENIQIGYEKIYVDNNNADTNYEDLRLMNNCKHNIIANSSFSWWGAWLNQNKEKIVIAPKIWFKDAKSNAEYTLPKEWIRI